MLMIFTDSRNLLPIPKLGKSCRNLRHDRVEPLAAQAEWGQQQGALLRPRLDRGHPSSVGSTLHTATVTIVHLTRYVDTSGSETILAMWQYWQ